MPPKPRKRPKKPGPSAALASSCFEKLPDDVFFEIYTHLDLRDILSLARTNKYFRKELMKPGVEYIWRNARANDEYLPEKPGDLSEPAYANLAYFNHCHNCLKGPINYVYWALRVRLCPACVLIKITPLREFLCYEDIIPRQRNTNAVLVCLKADLDKIQHDLAAFDPESDARKEYWEARKASTEVIMNHAQLCKGWAQDNYNEKESERHIIREERFDYIVEELSKLGWEEEIDMIPGYDLSRQKFATKSEALNERKWKTIEPAAVAFMEKMKANRLKREYDAIVAARAQLFISLVIPRLDLKHSCAPLPVRTDWLAMPEVKAILDLPADTTVDAASFAPFLAALPDTLAKWRRSMHQRLLDHIIRAHKPTREELEHEDAAVRAYAAERQTDVAALSLRSVALATCVLRCMSCARDDWYERNPPARATYRRVMTAEFMAEQPELYFPQVLSHVCARHHRLRLTTGHAEFELDVAVGKIVRAIVELHGMDPLATGTGALDNRGARMACLTCAEPAEGDTPSVNAQVMDWRAAVHHHSVEHYGVAPSFRIVSASERASAVAAEDAVAKQERANHGAPPADEQGLEKWLKEDPAPRKYKCRHCLEKTGGPVVARQSWLLKHHMRKEHGVNVVGPRDNFLDHEYPQAIGSGSIPAPTMQRVQLQPQPVQMQPQPVQMNHLPRGQAGQMHGNPQSAPLMYYLLHGKREPLQAPGQRPTQLQLSGNPPNAAQIQNLGSIYGGGPLRPHDALRSVLRALLSAQRSEVPMDRLVDHALELARQLGPDGLPLFAAGCGVSEMYALMLMLSTEQVAPFFASQSAVRQQNGAVLGEALRKWVAMHLRAMATSRRMVEQPQNDAEMEVDERPHE